MLACLTVLAWMGVQGICGDHGKLYRSMYIPQVQDASIVLQGYGSIWNSNGTLNMEVVSVSGRSIMYVVCVVIIYTPSSGPRFSAGLMLKQSLVSLGR